MAKSEASDYILPLYKDRAIKHLIKLAGGKDKIKNLLRELYVEALNEESE